MKDEELFRVWKSEQYKDQSTEEKMEFVEHLHTFPKHFEKTFLAGLKAGRPQWHTPDARLPEEEGDYLFYLRDGEETMYDIVGVSIDGNGYVSLDSHIWSITDVIAWCELPTFDKE